MDERRDAKIDQGREKSWYSLLCGPDACVLESEGLRGDRGPSGSNACSLCHGNKMCFICDENKILFHTRRK
jgi:hypothetical protein